MKKLIECVPNFSEGRDLNVIRQITDAIESVDGVSLLDVDPGASTNRTVVTFVGDPDATVEAAFRGIRKAAELIDMRKQKGAHPRMGATDVCPFIPVSNVGWEEAIECANRLGKRVGEELKIPVYLYERAARDKSRANLAVIRAGEYEGFFEKIKQRQWKPDFGPAVFNKKSGATAIGVRDFLIARNAASTVASGSPTNVTTVRFVLAPGSTSSNETPSTVSIASVICRITFWSPPSEKFGTHSISFFTSRAF